MSRAVTAKRFIVEASLALSYTAATSKAIGLMLTISVPSITRPGHARQSSWSSGTLLALVGHCRMDKPASVLTRMGTWTASPVAFGIVLVYAALWIAFERETLDWHGIATLATWLMTLVIQRSEHRDTQALHAKLDELLRATEGAKNDLAKVDEQEPEDVERQRDKMN